MNNQNHAEIEKEKMHKTDITLVEEIAFVIGDLWNMEKHMLKTISRGEEKKNDYMLFLNEIREQRKFFENLLLKVKNLGEENLKGDEWCCIKHLCGVMVQSGEVGSKLSFLERFDDAGKCFEASDYFRNLLYLLIKIIKGVKYDKVEGTA
jgi:hypothetical protein